MLIEWYWEVLTLNKFTFDVDNKGFIQITRLDYQR